MTCHICAGNTCLGECEPPIAYIENLEREVAELKAENQGQYEYLHKLQVRDNQNRVYINVLREALEDIAKVNHSSAKCGQIAQQVLASTPAQSLQVHDNEVIERCAVECEQLSEQYTNASTYYACAKGIRELKGKL